jgi:hypothetical protein
MGGTAMPSPQEQMAMQQPMPKLEKNLLELKPMQVLKAWVLGKN